MVKDILPGVLGSNPGVMTPLDQVLVFSADDGSVGTEPWVLDLCSFPGDSSVDHDGDGRRDFCETDARLADADLSGRVDGFDLARLSRAFTGSLDRAVDFNRDSQVDGMDLAILAAWWGQTIGGD